MRIELPAESEDMDPDQQEALSARYVIGLRLLLLSSGNIALFDRDGLVDIFKDSIVLEMFSKLLGASLEADKARIDTYRPFDSEPLVLKTGAQSAEDLGL